MKMLNPLQKIWQVIQFRKKKISRLVLMSMVSRGICAGVFQVHTVK